MRDRERAGRSRAHARSLACLVTLAAAVGCGAPPANLEEAVGIVSEAISGPPTVDWSQFPDGYQCMVGVWKFYPAKFGAPVPNAGNFQSGNCAPQGACNVWVDD